jgi:two-component system LytT family sensor kinase
MRAEIRFVDLPPLRVGAGLLLAWLGFWILMILVGVQEHLRTGGQGLWRPLIAEGSAMVVATLVAVVQWRLAKRLDPLLHEPRRWFARVLVWTPLVAIAFVVTVYALRLSLLSLAGVPYRLGPWGPVFAYETLKFCVFYFLFSGVHFGVRSYMAWNGERLRAERHQRLSQQAQLLQLTQQLQPHFLFNALNTVSSLIHTDPQRADALLTQLAALLRAATDVGQRTEQPLVDELKLLKGYAAIMTERFGDRVELRFEIDDAALTCPVPTLGLQPLLENCFRHVVEQRRAPTCIVVRARCAAARLTIEVEDDGGVLAAPAVFGVGLGNLQRRLEALHADRAYIDLQTREDGAGVRARLELPCAC